MVTIDHGMDIDVTLAKKKGLSKPIIRDCPKKRLGPSLFTISIASLTPGSLQRPKKAERL